MNSKMNDLCTLDSWTFVADPFTASPRKCIIGVEVCLKLSLQRKYR